MNSRTPIKVNDSWLALHVSMGVVMTLRYLTHHFVKMETAYGQESKPALNQNKEGCQVI